MILRNLVLAALLFISSSFAADDNISRKAAPTWITPPSPVPPNSIKNDQGSIQYLSVDLQHHIELGIEYQGYHIAILNEAGVKEFSQLSFDFQPEYQTLKLHSLQLKRGGKRLDRLADAKIEIIRREEGMAHQLYNGTLTAHIILEDVRPGDILSYSFSREGVNPVYRGHVHAMWHLGSSSNIEYMRRRILWNPERRSLKWQLIGQDRPIDARSLSPQLSELTWEGRSVKGIDPEGSTPKWHFDYPWLEYSDYPTWPAYGDWVRTIYRPHETLPQGLEKICDEIRATHQSPEEQVIGVLRWVQRNIRYLGSFMGEHTHAPYPLEEVYEKRFGDCKDKSMITVAMLRHLGFEAYPAFVNTVRGRGIERMLPGHVAFNHLIVHLRLNDEDHWLDPTYTFERGPLHKLGSQDYGFAFSAHPAATGLNPVVPRGIESEKTKIVEHFTIGDINQFAELRVTTTTTGGDANSDRYHFATNSLKETEKNYLEFYEALYPSIEVASPLRVEDDPESNRFVIHEHYRINKIWEIEEEIPNQHSVEFHAKLLRNRIRIPSRQNRQSPYSLTYPNHIIHRITADLSDDWDIPEGMTTIEDPHFLYHSRTEFKGSRLKLEYEFKARKADVAANDFNEFQENMGRVRDDLYYEIWNNADGSGVSGSGEVTGFSKILLAAAAVIGLILGTVVAGFGYFWDPPSRPPMHRQYVGLGGWMVLVTIGCLLNPLILLIDCLSFTLGVEDIEAHLDSLKGFDPWRLYCFFGAFFAFTLLPVSILEIVLLFRRRSSFPWFFIALSLAMIAGDFVLGSFEESIPDMEEGPTRLEVALKQSVSLMIWGSYVLTSQRVKATFNHRRSGPSLP